MFSRTRRDRTRTVNSSATVRHTSHPGKYEPRMSNEGARSHSADARHVNTSPVLECAFMAEARVASKESSRQSETRDSPERIATAYVPERPRIAPPRVSAERRSHPAGCEDRGCTIRARPHTTARQNRAGRWQPGGAEARS